MKKRGISPLISWVLLIGFVIGLSLMVTTWVKQQAETRADKLVEGVESDIRCNGVAFNAKLECNATPIELTIANKGKFTINKLTIRQPDNSYQLVVEIPPTEKKTKNLKSFITSDPADLIPIISINGKDVTCSARKIVISC